MAPTVSDPKALMPLDLKAPMGLIISDLAPMVLLHLDHRVLIDLGLKALMVPETERRPSTLVLTLTLPLLTSICLLTMNMALDQTEVSIVMFVLYFVKNKIHNFSMGIYP